MYKKVTKYLQNIDHLLQNDIKKVLKHKRSVIKIPHSINNTNAHFFSISLYIKKEIKSIQKFKKYPDEKEFYKTNI